MQGTPDKCRPSRVAGQALPLGLALLLVGTLGALVLFNTGQVATDKARTANAADAAAYSGLLWQARALNYQAYTNRAMVANQVSIAQAVSLHSWMDYGKVASEKLATALSWVPFINGVAIGIAKGMNVIATVGKPAMKGMVGAIDPINAMIGLSQEAMFASSFAATPDIVRSLVKASDPRFESVTKYAVAGLAANLAEWDAFTESHADDDVPAMTERMGVTMDSRDGFTRKRNWEFFDGFWFYSTPFTKHKLIRSGSTALTMHEGGDGLSWEWMAKDTVSFHTKIWKWSGSKRKELPFGWGEAYANDGGGGSLEQRRCDGFQGLDQPGCGYASPNDKAESIADAEAVAMPNYNGVRAFRSLSAVMLERDDHDPVLRLRTEVSMPLDDTVTSADTVGGDTFATGLTGPGNVMSSISVAEVHYRRPPPLPDSEVEPEGDRQREIANGYNPYWEVRLAPIAVEERLAAVLLREGSGDGGGRAPDATGTTIGSYDGTDPALPAAGSGGGGLGAFAENLAGAYGVGAAAMSGVLEERRTLAAVDIEGLELGDPVQMLGEGLKDVLHDAIENLLTGAFEGVVAEATGQVESAVARSETAQQLLAGRDAAMATAEEYERIREETAREFEAYLEQATERYESLRTDVLDRIAALKAEIRGMVGDVPLAMQQTLDRLELERDELVDELLDSLADELRAIVRRRGGAVMAAAMTREAARGIVDLLLEDYLNGVVDDIDVDDAITWND